MLKFWSRFLALACVLSVLVNGSGSISAQDDHAGSVNTPENAAQIEEIKGPWRGYIGDIAWSPDGQTLAVSTTLGLWLYGRANWEADPRMLVQFESIDVIYDHIPLAFSPDGTLLAFGDKQANVRLWDISADEELVPLDTYGVPVKSIAISPDGKTLIAGVDMQLMFWDIETGQYLKTWDSPRSEDYVLWDNLTFSPDGSVLATTGNWRGTLRIWDPYATTIEDAVLANVGAQPWDDLVRDIAFSADGSQIVTSSGYGGYPRVWDATTYEELPGPELLAFSVAISSQNILATAGSGSSHPGGYSGPTSVILTQLGTGEHIADWPGHEMIYRLAFSPDGQLLAVASSLGSIGLWSVPQQNNESEYRPLTTIAREPFLIQYSPEYFAFSPDGTQIAAAATDATVNVWDVATGTIIHTLDHASSSIPWNPLSISWSPDGTTITTGNNDWALRVWDAATGELKYELGDRAGWYVGWSLDSTRFVTNGMKIFDAAKGELVMELGYNWGVPYETEWSPDGTMIATASGWEGDDTQLWTATGEHLDSFQTGYSIAWSPDSTRLASIGQIRDVATGLPVVIIPAMGGEIGWHPDGEWIASTGEEAVFLWDATAGDQLAMWDLPGCDIRGFAWSNDGNRFAVNCLGDMSQPGFRNDLIIWERVR